MQAKKQSYPAECQQIMGNVVVKEFPRGYYTSEEFWQLVRGDVDNICRKYGIL
jgi:hypothetical protein